MRRILLLLFAMLLVGTLTGCWSRIEVNDLGIITMMAVDRSEDEQVRIWLQVAIPQRAAGASPGARGGGGDDGGPGLPFLLLSSEGRTIMEAARKAQMQVSRRLFWAHMRVVLVGEKLAREGVRPLLDFLTRYRELRLTNYVLAVRGDLNEVMSAGGTMEKLPAEHLREISRLNVGLETTLGDFARMLASKGGDPVMGLAELTAHTAAGPQAQSPSLGVMGVAVFHGDRLVGWLDHWDTRGLLWLRGEMKEGVVTAHLPGDAGPVAVEYRGARVRREVRVAGGRLTIYITATAEGELVEDQAGLDLTDLAQVRLAEESISRQVVERMQGTLERIREMQADAAGFGELVHRQLPGVWRQLEATWLDGEWLNAKVVLRAHIYIRRTGLSTRPRGVPEERSH